MMKRTLVSVIASSVLLLFASGTALAAGNYLADRHASRGVKCEACHGVAAPKVPVKKVKAEKCLACHGSYEKVAEKTKALKPNPHASHLGEVRCSDCHKGHAKPVLMCNDCHKFDMAPK